MCRKVVAGHKKERNSDGMRIEKKDPFCQCMEVFCIYRTLLAAQKE